MGVVPPLSVARWVSRSVHTHLVEDTVLPDLEDYIVGGISIHQR